MLLLCCWPSSQVLLPTQSKLMGCPSVAWKQASSIFKARDQYLNKRIQVVFSSFSSIPACNWICWTRPDAKQPWNVSSNEKSRHEVPLFDHISSVVSVECSWYQIKRNASVDSKAALQLMGLDEGARRVSWLWQCAGQSTNVCRTH